MALTEKEMQDLRNVAAAAGDAAITRTVETVTKIELQLLWQSEQKLRRQKMKASLKTAALAGGLTFVVAGSLGAAWWGWHAHQPTAKCGDGTLSFARHHEGACGGHGGVKQFLK